MQLRCSEEKGEHQLVRRSLKGEAGRFTSTVFCLKNWEIDKR